ncbi:class I SAM-dependent methyltransferase [Oerskovia flava]|uniref:class I SAM-dependent methyltransferase n=1 Tax=Oerskovia flava TaxID=2986422 RepID=UPI00223E9C59|nr:class I SAM-dependent methyltransferase [Oerskovia sp. JB1-3-2]
MPGTEDFTAAFDAAATDFSRLRPDLWEPVAHGTLAVSRPASGERVLDACCGDGASAMPTARAVGPDGHVDAVDLSTGLLSILRERARGLPHLHTVQADATTWGRPATYDLVQCVLGVFFFPDMEAGTRHLLSLARPGGRAALTIWRRGAIEPVGSALAEVVGVPDPFKADSDGETPLISRVNTVDAWGEWLTGLGLGDVTVHEAPHTLRLDDDLAWRLVVGSGYRGFVADLDDAQREDVRVRYLAELQHRGLATVDATTLVGTGTVAAGEAAA